MTTPFEKKSDHTRNYFSFREAENDLTKRAVVIENEEPIPTKEEHGNALFFSNSSTTESGEEKEILIVPQYSGSLNRRVKSFGVSTHIEGTCRIYENDSFIASCRTNASKCDSFFYFEPFKNINGSIKITFEARSNAPQSSVEVFLNSSEI